jgi:heme exporter protein CcmD
MELASPYAGYVWTAFAVSLGGLALATLWTLLAWRKAGRELRRVQHSETKI